MSNLRIACLLLLLVLSTTVTVSADIVPPHGSSIGRPFKLYSEIQLTVGNVPNGMVLILLGGRNQLLQRAHSDEVIRVSGESNLYLALENKLSKPFNYDKDAHKLIWLKQYRQDDIPASPGSPPPPKLIRSTVKTVGPQNYVLESRLGY